jgi:hypothetical protein
MLHLITYANHLYYTSKEKLLSEAYAIGWFDTITAYGPDDLDSDFKNRFKNILKNKRGGGYWIWKPLHYKKTF